MTKSDPLFSGLAAGLKPPDLELPDDTITVDTDLLKARERLRCVKASERLAELAEANLAVQRRIADAAERQADTFETLTTLFASCIGIGQAYCPGSADETPPVNYLRSGQGDQFRCDRAIDTQDTD